MRITKIVTFIVFLAGRGGAQTPRPANQTLEELQRSIQAMDGSNPPLAAQAPNLSSATIPPSTKPIGIKRIGLVIAKVDFGGNGDPQSSETDESKIGGHR